MPQTFKAFVYDVNTDGRRWEEFTRDSLLDSFVRYAFGRKYGFSGAGISRDQAKLVHSTMLKRAAADGPSEEETRAVLKEWSDWWAFNGESVLLAREYA